MTEAYYYLLDVFTEKKYGGNQLAIFPDARTIPENQFGMIARELNLSETVFLFPPDQEPHYSMRIFTPGGELPTAGHPTVGTAYFLARELNNENENVIRLQLQQKIGVIEVEISMKDNHPDQVTMYQPLPDFGPVHSIREEIASLLSLDVSELGNDPIQEVSCGNNTLLIPVNNPSVLSKIKFRLDQWDTIKEKIHNAFIYPFTLNQVKNGDVQGRMFAPDYGILEDPATGSANGPLICYLNKHNLVDRPVKSLQGYEMGRPSQLYLDVDKTPNGEITAVKVGGKSVLVGKGTLFLDVE